MRRYAEIFKIFFLQTVKTQLVYRSQVLQRFVGIFLTLLATTFFWLAVAKSVRLGTYTPEAMLFYFVMAAFHDFLFISGDDFTKKIGESIRMGKLSTALVQPFPYLLKIFANGLGGVAFRMVLILPIAFVLRCTLLKDFVFENAGMQVGFYTLALLLAVVLSLLCLIITGLLAFDMTQVWGPWVCLIATYCLLSGIFYPADLASGLIKTLMHWLPFYYMLGFPILILIGRLEFPDIVLGFAHGLFAVFYLSLLLNFMWRRGIKIFEAIGI